MACRFNAVLATATASIGATVCYNFKSPLCDADVRTPNPSLSVKNNQNLQPTALSPRSTLPEPKNQTLSIAVCSMVSATAHGALLGILCKQATPKHVLNYSLPVGFTYMVSNMAAFQGHLTEENNDILKMVTRAVANLEMLRQLQHQCCCRGQRFMPAQALFLLGCDAAFAVMQTKSLHQLQEHYLSDRFGKTHARTAEKIADRLTDWFGYDLVAPLFVAYVSSTKSNLSFNNFYTFIKKNPLLLTQRHLKLFAIFFSLDLVSACLLPEK